jgi:hypothetical protein
MKMRTLPWRCGAIVGWMAAVMEMDRRSDFFAVGTSGYLVATGALLLFVVPALRRVQLPWLIAIAFPIFCGLEVATGRIDPRTVVDSLLEFGAVAVTLLLAAGLARRLALAEEVLNQFAVGPPRELAEPFSRTQGEMFREVRRARRYERPLSLIALSASGLQPPAALAQLLEQARRESIDRYVAAKVGALLDEQTAGSTLIAERGDHFLLLLPETGLQEAEHVAKRLERVGAEQHGISLRFGIASFPHQEITFDKLLETAEAQLREARGDAGEPQGETAAATQLAPSTQAGT